MADLPIKYYLTTNYGDLMLEALKKNRKKGPCVACAKWNEILQDPDEYKTPFDDSDYEPSNDEPLIYHFHGRIDDWRSIVLTEDDYIKFLINMQVKDVIHGVALKALGNSSLAFIGYSLEDVTLRTIITIRERITAGLRPRGVTVLVDPSNVLDGKLGEAKEYLRKRMGVLNLSIYWGDANRFAKELHDRWEQWRGEPAQPH